MDAITSFGGTVVTMLRDVLPIAVILIGFQVLVLRVHPLFHGLHEGGGPPLPKLQLLLRAAPGIKNRSFLQELLAQPLKGIL